MNIEQMNDLAGHDLKVATNAAARLAGRRREIVHFHLLHGKTAENYIAIGRTAKFPSLADPVFEADRIGKIARLVLLPAAAAEAYDFLQGDDVGIELAQHIGHS